MTTPTPTWQADDHHEDENSATAPLTRVPPPWVPGTAVASPRPPLPRQPAGPVDLPKQVFVDYSGRRMRWLRRSAAATGACCVAYLAVLAVSLGGGILEPTSRLPLVDVMAPLVTHVPVTSGAGNANAGGGTPARVAQRTRTTNGRPVAPAATRPRDTKELVAALLSPSSLRPTAGSTPGNPAGAPGTPAASGTPARGTGAPGTVAPATPARATPAPETPASGTAAPGTAAPATPATGTPTPGTGTPPPVTPDPGPPTPAPPTPNPGTADPGTPAPGTPAPGTTDPGAPGPGTTDPGTPGSGATGPSTP